MFTHEAAKPGADVSPENEDKTDKAEAKAEASEDKEHEADPPPADKEKVEEKPEPKLQGRIDKLTRRFRESERETAQVRVENAELQKKLDERPEPKATKTLEDFEFDDNKYRDYLFSEAESRAEKAAERIARTYQDKTRDEVVDEKYASKEKTFAATVDDFHDSVYAETLKISAAMADEIRLSEIGPEMAYHLAKNPEVSSEINALSPRETVRRMTLLEADLKAEKAKAEKKEVSKAPPPTPGIKAGDAGIEKGFREGMSDAEFAKLRRKQIANR